MKLGTTKLIVIAVIVVIAIVAISKYTSDKIGSSEGGDSLAGMLTEGLADKPATQTEGASAGSGEQAEGGDEEWDKPYSKSLVDLIDKTEEAEKNPPKQTDEDSQKMAGGEAKQIFSDEYKMKANSFPLVEKISLEERARYSVSFETDKEIRFVVYSKASYESWKESGQHGRSKITTKSGPVCCAKKGSYSMDVNIGEGGDYYFVFDSSDIGFESELPTQAKLQVTRTGGI